MGGVALGPARTETNLPGHDTSEVFDAFSQWLSTYAGGTGDTLRQGEALARRRREAMRHLMAQDPAEALHKSISPGLRASLSESLKPFVERPVSGYGTISRLYVCGTNTEELLAVRLGSQLYTAHAPEGRAMTGPTGRRVPISGIAIGSLLALAQQPARLIEPGEHWPDWPWSETCLGCGARLVTGYPAVKAVLGGYAVPLCCAEHLGMLNSAVAGAEGGSVGTAPGPPPEWTLGDKTVLYLVAQYSDQGAPPTTRPVAETALAQVSQYYQVQSYQQTALTATVTDPILLPQSLSHYNDYGLGELYNDAVAAASLAGWNADDYDFVMIRHGGSRWGIGVGMVGEKGAWVQTDDWRVIAHELGHNYGLHHANGWRPITTAPYGPGQNVEYGDPYDLMGPNRGSFNTYERCVLHWMPEAAILPVTSNGVFRLHAFDVPSIASNRLYALRLGRDVRDYWLDYRGEFQSGPYAPFTLNGLQIRWSSWSQSRGGSALLDTTPGTPRRFEDGPLAVGHTYSDRETDLHVTVVDRSPTPGEWLDVAVNVVPPITNRNPAVSISASAANVSVGESVTLQVSASDPDGDDLAYGWSTTVNGSLVPVWGSSNSPSMTLAWAAAGHFEVRCRVSDRKGGSTSASLLLSVGSSSEYTISGSVTNQGGLPEVDALVFALDSAVSTNTADYVTHASYRSARTDETGGYTLLNLTAGQYTVRGQPSATQNLVVSGTNTVGLGPSVSGMDLVALAKPPAAIRGVVRDGSSPVSNAVVETAGYATVSGPDGSFVFSNLPPASYVLTASLGDRQFIAPGNPVYLDGSDSGTNPIYRVLYQVSGEIRGFAGPVTVGTGEPGRSVSALPDFDDFSKPWHYALAVPRGVWNLEASHGGYTFVTDGFTNPVVVAGLERPYLAANGIQSTAFTNLHFAAVPGTTYAIRGQIMFEGGPLPRVTVSSGTNTVFSDSLGRYSVGGLGTGTYDVSPSQPGFAFNPGNAVVNLVNQDATGIDFEATDILGSPDWLTIEPVVGGAFRIRLEGIPGRTYTVQHRDGLRATGWNDLSAISTDWQGQAAVTNHPPPTVDERFYRTLRGAAVP
jgi:hypothetical protein